MDLTEQLVIPRRTLPIIFVINTSSSMYGSKIGAVNTVMDEVVPQLREVSENNSDARIEIAVLEYSTEARWVNEVPIDINYFKWEHLKASGLSNFSSACMALNEQLSNTTGFLRDPAGIYMPIIILISDSNPADDWEHNFRILKNNKWFCLSVKFAISIGDDVDRDFLTKFTNTEEAVIDVHNRDTFKSCVKFIDIDEDFLHDYMEDAMYDAMKNWQNRIAQDEMNSSIQQVIDSPFHYNKTEFGKILNMMYSKQRELFFKDTKIFRSVLRDFTANEFKKEVDLLVTMHQIGCIEHVRNTVDYKKCRKTLVNRLEDEFSLSPSKTGDMLDILYSIMEYDW